MNRKEHPMKLPKGTTAASSAPEERFAKNRRAILMAVIGGAAGIISPSAQAGDGRRNKGGSGRVTEASDQDDDKRTMKDGMRPQFQDLKKLGPDRQVKTIRYRQDTYTVTTADGQSTDFWEANLRFRIDSSGTGPLHGKPVILPTGMMGDRTSVFFASPQEIGTFIKHQY